jgi:6-phosphogluconolactonase/glucosamine-6-phosphate isomerase/deaminase
MTPSAIAALDCAIVYAKGPEKAVTLEALKQTMSIADQPAQALKQVSKCIVFNDHQGELL